MTASPAVHHTVLSLLLAGVVVSAWLLLTHRAEGSPRSYLTGPEAESAHLVMNTGMAVMLTPWFTPPARIALIAVFAGLAAAFAAALLTGALCPAGRWGGQRAACTYHAAAASAMVYATVGMPAGHRGGGTHGMHHPLTHSPSAWAVALAAVFALDAAGTLVVALALPASVLRPAARVQSPGAGPTPVLAAAARRRLRAAVVPHLAMDLGMVAMLIGAA